MASKSYDWDVRNSQNWPKNDQQFLDFSISVPIRFFWNFAIEWMLKNLTGPAFTVFGIVRFFEMNNFVLKLGFLRPSTLCQIFVSFSKTCFLCDFFSNSFSSKLPSLFTRNETFCEHKGLLKVFGTVRFTGDLQLKIFSKNDEIFFSIFLFF